MLKINTHQRIHPDWVGTPVVVDDGVAEVTLVLRDEMRGDDTGLVHGGFTFGLADYAAMLAVNEPTVVLAKADTAFLAPTQVGDEVCAKAKVTSSDGKKRIVDVVVECVVGDEATAVFKGTFHCVVPRKHVLAK